MGELMVQEKKEKPLVVDSVPTELTIAPPRKIGSEEHLTEEQREFLLQQLAQFRSYKEINQALFEHYGRTMRREAVDYYLQHPKWYAQVRMGRLAYLTKTIAVPIANKIVRMERYEKLYHMAMARGNHEAALKYLHSAGEEMDRLHKESDVRDIYINQQIAYFDRHQCEKRLSEMEADAKQQGVLDAVSQTSTVVSTGQ